jgi:hypothetical protein
MLCAISESDDPISAERGIWVMRFPNSRQARQVAAATGQPLTAKGIEVELPELLTDLEVASHYGFVQTDMDGVVRSWIVP